METAKLPGQFKSAAIDPRFDRAFRQPQLVGDFLVRELLQVAQHDGLPERRRQFGQRLADQVTSDRPVRARRSGSRSRDAGVSVDASTSRAIVSRSLRTLR